MIRCFFIVLVLGSGCAGDDEETISRQATPCENLREHLVDLRLADAVNVDKDAHREALRAAMDADFIDGCSKLADDAIRCAMQAHDSTSAAACAGTTTENR